MPGFFSNFASKYDGSGANSHLDRIEKAQAKTQSKSNKNQSTGKKAKKKVIKANTDSPLPKKKGSSFQLSGDAIERRKAANAAERKRLLAE